VVPSGAVGRFHLLEICHPQPDPSPFLSSQEVLQEEQENKKGINLLVNICCHIISRK
jgi:hypothetical protein